MQRVLSEIIKVSTLCLHYSVSNMTTVLLKPGDSIKPIVQRNEVEEILKNSYGLTSISITELNAYDDKNYHVKVDKNVSNKFFTNVREDGYILKITNSLESKNENIFQAQNQLLLYLGSKGVCCPKPVQTTDGHYIFQKMMTCGTTHIVRLFEFISGSILNSVPVSNDLFHEAGKFAAQLDEALKDFSHPAYENHSIIWHLQSVPQLAQFLFVIADPDKKEMVNDIVNQFSKTVLPISHQLEKGLIHGDFNEQNVLLEEVDGLWQIKGILDFGDVHLGCYLYELAITMTYMMLKGFSLEVGRYVLSGYLSVKSFSDQELGLLKCCVAARLCQSLVLGAYSSRQDPGNAYILTTSKLGWTLLKELWYTPTELLMEKWGNKNAN